MKRNIFIHLLSTLPFIGTLPAKKKKPRIKTFQVTQTYDSGWINIERVEFQDDLKSKPIDDSINKQMIEFYDYNDKKWKPYDTVDQRDIHWGFE